MGWIGKRFYLEVLFRTERKNIWGQEVNQVKNGLVGLANFKAGYDDVAGDDHLQVLHRHVVRLPELELVLVRVGCQRELQVVNRDLVQISSGYVK